MAAANGRRNLVEQEAAAPARECSLWNSWAGLEHPFCSSQFLVRAANLPVRGGEVLLLLEFLLQAHELDLGEDGPTSAWLLRARWGLLCLRLAAALGLAGGNLCAPSSHAGLGWQQAGAGREQRGQRGRLPGDDGEEGVGPERRRACREEAQADEGQISADVFEQCECRGQEGDRKGFPGSAICLLKDKREYSPLWTCSFSQIAQLFLGWGTLTLIVTLTLGQRKEGLPFHSFFRRYYNHWNHLSNYCKRLNSKRRMKYIPILFPILFPWGK